MRIQSQEKFHSLGLELRVSQTQIWSPDLGPDEGTRGPETVSQSRRVGPLRSSAYLAAPKTSREKGPIFGHARRRHGAGKRVHFGSPHRSLEFTSRRFSQPPISTPQQLSSGLRYTHCDANLGNSHRSISLKPISKTPNMLLCFHSKAELQLLTFRHRYMTWLAKPTRSAHGEHHFQNHHERSIRSKNAYPKPGKIPLPESGTAGLADPNLVPRSGPRRGYTRPRNSVAESQSWTSAVFGLLSGSKNKPRKGTHFWARTSQTRGRKKGSFWVAS